MKCHLTPEVLHYDSIKMKTKQTLNFESLVRHLRTLYYAVQSLVMSGVSGIVNIRGFFLKNYIFTYKESVKSEALPINH